MFAFERKCWSVSDGRMRRTPFEAPSSGMCGGEFLPLRWVSRTHLLLWTSPGPGWRLGAGPGVLSLAPQTRNEPPEPQASFSPSSACGSHLPWPVMESTTRSDSWQRVSFAGLTESTRSLLNTSLGSSRLLANPLGAFYSSSSSFFFFFYQKQIGKQILCFRLLGSRQVEKRVCANINYIKIAVSGNDSEKREDCSWGCLAHFSAHEVNDNVKFSIYALNVILKSGLK